MSLRCNNLLIHYIIMYADILMFYQTVIKECHAIKMSSPETEILSTIQSGTYVLISI